MRELLLNPTKLTEKDPKVKKFLDLIGALPEATKVLRYVVYCYDPASPVVRDNHHLDARKNQALQLAGIDLVKDEILADSLKSFSEEWFVEVVNAYLREVKSRKWAMIVSNEQMWWEWNARLLKKTEGKGDKDVLQAVELKGKIADLLDGTSSRLDAYYSDYFYGDEVLEEKSQGRGFTPESLAVNV